MMPCSLTLKALALFLSFLGCNGFVPTHRPFTVGSCCPPKASEIALAASPSLMPDETTISIAAWTFAFASSHIGMSSIRNTLIDSIGRFADESLGIVNRVGWNLPDLWPGDDVGGQAIFPSPDIAGRQLYRILYTIISFGTLGTALKMYLMATTGLHHTAPPNSSTLLQWIAAVSWGCSIASLVNPSPLSLVPVYEANNDVHSQGLMQRKDANKLVPYGMTRITRHPLILPSSSWSIATMYSVGASPPDVAFFGILALYGICGCLAQDLRVLKDEGSVGTVFEPDNSLQDFFQQTSFIPFGAVLDGRQSLQDVVQQIPWLALGAGTLVGYQVQGILLRVLQHR